MVLLDHSDLQELYMYSLVNVFQDTLVKNNKFPFLELLTVVTNCLLAHMELVSN